MIALFPWQHQDWTRISHSLAGLHHGLMLTGISGIGKREFSVKLAQRLLCSQTEHSEPCGSCQNCKLFFAGSHPDLHVLATEEEAVDGRIDLITRYSDRYQDAVARDKKANPGKVITVDQVRLLIDRFYQSSHISSARVVIFLPADRMNINAANALLKLLEEPPESAYFILVAEHPGVLPTTVRSRCILHPLTAPDDATAKSWIRQQYGEQEAEGLVEKLPYGPLDILRNIESGLIHQQQDNIQRLAGLISGKTDPVELAGLLSKQETLPFLGWLHQICADLIRWQALNDSPDWIADIALQPAQVSPLKLHALYDKIGRYRRIARDQLNAQLALEELLITMQQTLGRV